MRVVIDRFEGSFAVVELPDKKLANIPKMILPHDAKEGDILIIEIDRTETEKQKKEIEGLFNELIE